MENIDFIESNGIYNADDIVERAAKKKMFLTSNWIDE